MYVIYMPYKIHTSYIFSLRLLHLFKSKTKSKKPTSNTLEVEITFHESARKFS